MVANISRCPLAAWNVNEVVAPGATAANVPALNVILRRDYVFELDRRLRAGGAVVVIVVTGRKGESCEKQSRSECGEKVLFFHS